MSKIELIIDAATKAFEGERERGEQLEGKAEKYMGAVAAIAGFQLFDFKVLTAVTSSWVRLPAGLSLVLLGGALLVAFYSLRVRRHHFYPGKTQLLDELDAADVGEEDAHRALARLLLESREHNATINDRRADLIEISQWLILAGFFCVAFSRIAQSFI